MELLEEETLQTAKAILHISLILRLIIYTENNIPYLAKVRENIFHGIR